ncbi:MAG TPA: RecQ family ATP-dependent DNA helicase [Gemmatimonadales bacterium]
MAAETRQLLRVDHRLRLARELLRHHFGYPEFRPAQTRVLRSIFAGLDTLAVLPTGGGKSICFQVPALVFGGLSIVVSPLISLMQDQITAARARGITADGLNSTQPQAEQRRVWEELRGGRLRLLYVSPERLRRLALELREGGIRPTLLAVDEAHCIAEWGHDFRPSYRTLQGSRYRLGRPQTIALTGSATPTVRQDIVQALCFSPGRHAIHLGSFDRANLWFGVVRVPGERERLNALLDLLRGDDRMAIVYVPTRGVSEALAGALRTAGHRAEPYHAGLAKARRAATLEAFLDDRLDVVVATCAFGMGIDKPNIRLVVHWTLPPTPESYYQEAGRAGRDGEFARCVLLWRKGDAHLHRRQLDVTFPPRATLERIWRESAQVRGVPRGVLASAERLRFELRPDLGAIDWASVERRRRQAEARIAAMEGYASGSGCRRRLLVGYFGEKLRHCSGCDRCGSRSLGHPESGATRARLLRVRSALGGRRGPWGGGLLEPDVMLRLARCPPADAAALADVPGVGPALAAAIGRTLLQALGAADGTRDDDPVLDPLTRVLWNWRSTRARDMGVVPFVLLGDSTLQSIARARPGNRRELAAMPGLGPRALAKFGDELLRLVRGWTEHAPPGESAHSQGGSPVTDRGGGDRYASRPAHSYLP